MFQIQSIFFYFKHVTDHNVFGYEQFFLSPYTRIGARRLIFYYSCVHKPWNLSDNSEFKYTWDKLGPFSEQVITKTFLLSGRSFVSLNTLQYPVNVTVCFPTGNMLMNKF